MDDYSRRKFVAATALAGIGALAGCSDGEDGGGAVGTEDGGAEDGDAEGDEMGTETEAGEEMTETEASFNPRSRPE
jgi:hypothetical protein